MKIGVIVGTTRRTRFADQPAAWFMELASSRTDMDFELLDCATELPFFDEVASGASAPTQSEAGRRWQEKAGRVRRLRHHYGGIQPRPAGGAEKRPRLRVRRVLRKPVAFVGYGAVGAVRAIEQLRQIVNNFEMMPIRTSVHTRRRLHGGRRARRVCTTSLTCLLSSREC